jgi:5-methylcytosine-specific restriction endonuclease McrA
VLSDRLADRAETIEMVCDALQKGDTQKAGEFVRSRYPFNPPVQRRRNINRLDRMRVFLRDGFIDRYSGDRLFFPPVLEVISMRIPDEFPSHPNGKFSECHVAHWELYSSVDHLVPLARGGPHEMENWVTTSMMRNLIKSHWKLEDLGWDLLPPGHLKEWDGLLQWFLQYVEVHEDLLALAAFKDWHRSAIQAIKEA